ncbi:hypothetical protein [Blastochloris tepida]|uniref:Uncharacterized protein n=1 Tax=Blastochloris tepida TaxID=2233851 RepID=A0A348FZD1_9HYPH|nr:hypothetical protein [Blastochloris tepida]BBF92664.1 hypothetical protein BLTE_13490 [Blastochloris tepida]
MPKSAPDYFELQPVNFPPVPPRGQVLIMTAAVLSCSLCGHQIAGMGGPGDGAICPRCADLLRRGELRGCVKWEG